MLRLLVDEHLSQEIAEHIRAHNLQVSITSVHHWRDGIFCGQDDDILLAAAHEEQLTLVTYDQRTILPLIRWWGTEGRSHSGVIMVSEKTIRSDDFGALVRSLLMLWEHHVDEDWTDLLLYLTDHERAD